MGFIALFLFYLAIRIIVSGNEGSAALAGVAIAGGGFCLIFFFLSQFKRFKGFGVEAESWEREMEDAERIAENFRNLARIVAQPSITALMRMGRWDSGISRREAHDLVQQFESILRAADATDDEIKQAKRDYVKYTLVDMIMPIHNDLKTILNKKLIPYEHAVNTFPQPIADHGAHKKVLSERTKARQAVEEALDIIRFSEHANVSEKIQSNILNCQLLSEEEAKSFIVDHIDAFNDIIYFEQNQAPRRPDVWFSQDE